MTSTIDPFVIDGDKYGLTVTYFSEQRRTEVRIADDPPFTYMFALATAIAEVRGVAIQCGRVYTDRFWFSAANQLFDPVELTRQVKAKLEKQLYRGGSHPGQHILVRARSTGKYAFQVATNHWVDPDHNALLIRAMNDLLRLDRAPVRITAPRDGYNYAISDYTGDLEPLEETLRFLFWGDTLHGKPARRSKGPAQRRTKRLELESATTFVIETRDCYETEDSKELIAIRDELKSQQVHAVVDVLVHDGSAGYSLVFTLANDLLKTEAVLDQILDAVAVAALR